MLKTTKTLILASKSPRRQSLLKEMGLPFEVRTKNVKEDYPPNLPTDQIALYLADLKAEALRSELKQNQLLITADTTVIQGEVHLAKPSNALEAQEMLQGLSGKTHWVITGVCLLSQNEKISFKDSTEVKFRNLDEMETEFYIQNFKPYDKAGAYGIQEWIGMIGIESIKGSYYNVMGLPTEQLYVHLKKMGIIQF